MIIKGIKRDGWPRLSTLGPSISKEIYRALQSGESGEVDDSVAARLVASGVCVVVDGGDEGGEA